MKARNDGQMNGKDLSALRVGDGCVILYNFYRCGGPRTGEYREHSARRPYDLPDGSFGRASHRVTGVSADRDTITGTVLRYVEVEEI